jgi:hypothetical protein
VREPEESEGFRLSLASLFTGLSGETAQTRSTASSPDVIPGRTSPAVPETHSVSEPNSPIPELFAENPILLSQVFQGVLLALIRPSCEDRSHKAKGTDADHFRLSYHRRQLR